MNGETCGCRYPDFWGGHQFCGHCGKPGKGARIAQPHPDTHRLDWLLQNRAVVIDGHVYAQCDWRTGDLVCAIGVGFFKTDQIRRQAIDTAMRIAEEATA